MTHKHHYKTERQGNAFVLVQTTNTHGTPTVQVPYSFKQEADIAICAAAHTATEINAYRRLAALDLAKMISNEFLAFSDLDADRLLLLREKTEDLITHCIAEIRNQNPNSSPEESNKKH
ncbi:MULTISPECIES: hypothetical protein [Acetobacter]|uniref:hypothetical protein n=1 Tax=Acetobacter TaxID=434 RepID=UPI0003180B4E|nr:MULTISPECIES: hypothetical protein [Acetobacter]AXC27582.1 hypothetical protein DS739_13090 [Acetobacter sp. JWB]KAA8387744.1 hypothetical protein FKW31_03655 [Acetobacter sp. DmW_136]KAA8426555.1 hypothetical protein FKW54_06930 [Acetobacter pomorum]KAA8436028.1 hypothetical protein FKW50_05790 [Acetobacter pomorum]KAA8454050.1 hypothetical protein FKW52_01840 [Acetobacter pomorum]